MSIRCKDLGTNLSLEVCGPATRGFCPTASAPTGFCPTASASTPIDHAVNMDFEPLRAQLREALGH